MTYGVLRTKNNKQIEAYYRWWQNQGHTNKGFNDVFELIRRKSNPIGQWYTDDKKNDGDSRGQLKS